MGVELQRCNRKGEGMRGKLRAKIIEEYGTQRRFAQIMGATPATITHVVKGQTTPRGASLVRWCSLLKIEPNEIPLFFDVKVAKTEQEGA